MVVLESAAPASGGRRRQRESGRVVRAEHARTDRPAPWTVAASAFAAAGSAERLSVRTDRSWHATTPRNPGKPDARLLTREDERPLVVVRASLVDLDRLVFALAAHTGQATRHHAVARRRRARHRSAAPNRHGRRHLRGPDAADRHRRLNAAAGRGLSLAGPSRSKSSFVIGSLYALRRKCPCTSASTLGGSVRIFIW